MYINLGNQIILVEEMCGCNQAQPAGKPVTQVVTPTMQNTVEIREFAFVPLNLTVLTGSTVTWVNRDQAPHTITSDNGLFDSGTFNTGQSYSYSFANPGTYSYHCTIHPNMIHGTIAVQ